jgi:glycosyltransferase involved in cell wall biosynthesis
MTSRSIPKISVIMCVHNGEKYLNRAVDSILYQTFEDFEFIVIDDASTDSTNNILSKYKDNRLRIFRNTHQMGLYKSSNIGLRQAFGDYIARMDADDISLPERLEKEKKFLDENPDYALVGTCYFIIDQSDRILDKAGIHFTNEDIQKIMLIGNCFGHGTTMFRRDCIEKVGFYNEEFKYSGDYDLWLRISERYKVCNLNEFLYKWRMHDQGISQAHHTEQDSFAEKARLYAVSRRIKEHFQDLSKEQEELIEFLEKQYKEKEYSISRLQAEITEGQSKILLLEKQYKEKEYNISRLQAEITEGQSKILLLEKQYKEKEYNISRLQAEITEGQSKILLLETEIHSFRDSLGYRVLSKYRRLKQRLFPSGSGRRAVYERCLKKMKKQK